MHETAGTSFVPRVAIAIVGLSLVGFTLVLSGVTATSSPKIVGLTSRGSGDAFHNPAGPAQPRIASAPVAIQALPGTEPPSIAESRMAGSSICTPSSLEAMTGLAAAACQATSRTALLSDSATPKTPHVDLRHELIRMATLQFGS